MSHCLSYDVESRLGITRLVLARGGIAGRDGKGVVGYEDVVKNEQSVKGVYRPVEEA